MAKPTSAPSFRGAAVAMALGVFALGGCATSSIEDAVPQAALQPTPSAGPLPGPAERTAGAGSPVSTSNAVREETAAAFPAAPSTDSSGAARQSGAFPDLNVPQRGATAQMTPAESRAKMAELRAAQQAQASDGGTAARAAAEQRRLQALRQSHATDVLKEIEGE